MRKKKDVLFLCQFFYPEYVSSATLPFDTASALVRAGYTVDALCGWPREYTRGETVAAREEKDGIRIRRLRYFQMDKRSRLGRLVNQFSFTAAVLLRLPVLARYRAAVVYSNPPMLPWAAALAKRLFGTKLVFVAYDLYPEVAVTAGAAGENGLMSRVMRHINRAVFTRADRVVALSNEMREFILKNRPVSGDRVAVIPNWYRDEGESGPPGPENRFYREYAGCFVVSYLGNMGTIQDMDTVLEAVRLLRDEPSVRFLFAGHGNKLEQIRRTVEEEGLENARVLGFLHGKDYQDALEISGCAVVSLIRGLAGICVPSKAYSYMMRGIPLLAILGPSDIVRDAESGAGIRIENGDGASLAAAILRIRDDPELAAGMRRRCRSVYLENYTEELAAGRYEALICGLLADDGARRTGRSGDKC